MSQIIPETPAEYDKTHIIERPDGFYWQYMGTDEEFGPFATLLEAVEDMKYNADAAIEPGESLLEAEDELGIADWIDPETGAPAEGYGPHLEDH
jgi:hypothetical protein